MTHSDAMTGTLPSDLSVVLPGDWWKIPVQDEARAVSAVRRLVDHQFRGLDDQPHLKAEVRRKLTRTVSRARGVNGRTLAICLMEAAGLPIDATLTTYWMVLGPASGRNHLDDLADEMLDLPTGGVAGTETLDTAIDRSELGAGRCLRRVRVIDNADPDVAEANSESLVVDYWIEMPGRFGLVQLAFSTSLVAWREKMVGLFDAIAGTTSWLYEQPDSAASNASE